MSLGEFGFRCEARSSCWENRRSVDYSPFSSEAVGFQVEVVPESPKSLGIAKRLVRPVVWRPMSLDRREPLEEGDNHRIMDMDRPW